EKIKTEAKESTRIARRKESSKRNHTQRLSDNRQEVSVEEGSNFDELYKDFKPFDDIEVYKKGT
ncbi:hypothetical protein, partial [Sulfuricurvum sp.]|uniref:hypothetical protein n=1 Tax=Sulfuricurvum sp. TaxID=2025608 RepID=UPI002E378E6F